MRLDDLLQLLQLKVVLLVLLQVQDDLRTTTKTLTALVLLDRELTTGSRLPDVLLVLVALRHNNNTVSNKVRRVETNTELTNHAHVRVPRAELLHEHLRPRTGNRTEVVNQLALRHANTSVLDRQRTRLLVRADVDPQVGAARQLALVLKTLHTDLVQRIRRVGNQLTQEDVLVRVERVDDQAQQLVDLRLELISLLRHHARFSLLASRFKRLPSTRPSTQQSAAGEYKKHCLLLRKRGYPKCKNKQKNLSADATMQQQTTHEKHTRNTRETHDFSPTFRLNLKMGGHSFSFS